MFYVDIVISSDYGHLTPSLLLFLFLASIMPGKMAEFLCLNRLHCRIALFYHIFQTKQNRKAITYQTKCVLPNVETLRLKEI